MIKPTYDMPRSLQYYFSLPCGAGTSEEMFQSPILLDLLVWSLDIVDFSILYLGQEEYTSTTE